MTGVSADTADAIIRVERVSKSFGDVPVLNDVSLTVTRGRTVVIIGPSGSGKSTLLRCINLLESVDSGSIIFDGQDISSLRKDAHLVRRDLAMVFQNFELFQHLTAAENIMLAPIVVKGLSRQKAHDRALELLAKVHIPDKADSYPDELSGGQQQRVAIARALAMDPKVILYDEPTSALDPEMIREVLEVILELSQGGMTSVVVTHEMGFARRAADHIVFMSSGRVVESGPAQTFFDGAVNKLAREFLQNVLH
jgi:polar amino acid transport system ATP-binding protein